MRTYRKLNVGDVVRVTRIVEEVQGDEQAKLERSVGTIGYVREIDEFPPDILIWRICDQEESWYHRSELRFLRAAPKED